MPRQRMLRFRDEPDVDALWARFPEGSRRHLILTLSTTDGTHGAADGARDRTEK